MSFSVHKLKFPSWVLSLVAAFLVSCVVVIPFLPSLGTTSRSFLFQVDVASDSPGEAQVFYDIGLGIHEGDSMRVSVPHGESYSTLTVALPAGNYRQLRFDPIDRPARLSLRNARINTLRGKLVHRFSPDDFTPQHQIAEIDKTGDTVRLVTAPAGNDPTLFLSLNQPLQLIEKQPVLSDLLYRAPGVFAVLVIGMLAMRFSPRRWRERARGVINGLSAYFVARPQRAVAFAALIAVTLGSYPIIFLGKSFVSPNFSDGTYLLYGEYPTLPGYRDATTEDAKGSDVGAIIWQHIPYSFIQHRALLQYGELPLWNRYNSAGTVLLGQGQSMFGDPLHLPVILANGAAWAWDLKYLSARWLLCCGIGLIVLRCTRRIPPAVISALSAAFVGFFIYRLNHPAYFSFCYAPWILYAWIRIAEAGNGRALASGCGLLILASIAELNSGTVKEAYMLLFGMHFAGLLVLLFANRSGKFRLIALAAATWAGVLFVLLTAPVWMTFMNALGQAYTSYNLPTAFQIHPSVALGFFDELFYRPLVTQERVFNPSANFLVLIGVLYFVATFSRSAGLLHARALGFGALLPIAIVFGLIPPQWIASVPFLGNVAHIDNSFSCVLIVLSLVISGIGWSTAWTRLSTPEARGDLCRMAALFALLVFPWIALNHTVHRPAHGPGTTFTLLDWGQHLPVSGFVWGSLVALTAASIVLLWGLRKALLHRSMDYAGLLLIGVSLTVLLWRHGVHVRQVGPADFVSSPSVRVDFHTRSPAIAALKADQTEPARALGLGEDLFPGWSANYDIEGISGADALLNPYFRDLLAGLGVNQIWNWRTYIQPPDVAGVKPAMDFLNVRYYLDLRSDQSLLGSVLTLVKPGDLDLYRSETTWPRAFFSRQLSTYQTVQEFGEKVRRGNGQPFAAMQQDDVATMPSLATLISGDLTFASIERATDYRLTTNTTAFTISASGPGVAVLHETFLKDAFRVTINGEPASYFRVNHAFKGVQLPAAGSYRIEFSYWPRGMTMTLIMAGAGIASVLLTGFPLWRGPLSRLSFE